jgi:hypothetical protein
MKNSLRKIHINNIEWKWVVESLNHCTIKEIRIYSPNKKMWRVKPEDISDIKTYEEIGGDTYFTIKPQMVKNYIVTNLMKNELSNFRRS